jgi:hypothetical protein
MRVDDFSKKTFFKNFLNSYFLPRVVQFFISLLAGIGQKAR